MAEPNEGLTPEEIAAIVDDKGEPPIETPEELDAEKAKVEVEQWAFQSPTKPHRRYHTVPDIDKGFDEAERTIIERSTENRELRGEVATLRMQLAQVQATKPVTAAQVEMADEIDSLMQELDTLDPATMEYEDFANKQVAIQRKLMVAVKTAKTAIAEVPQKVEQGLNARDERTKKSDQATRMQTELDALADQFPDLYGGDLEAASQNPLHPDKKKLDNIVEVYRYVTRNGLSVQDAHALVASRLGVTTTAPVVTKSTSTTSPEGKVYDNLKKTRTQIVSARTQEPLQTEEPPASYEEGWTRVRRDVLAAK